jgi:hypothetical protein
MEFAYGCDSIYLTRFLAHHGILRFEAAVNKPAALLVVIVNQ